MRRLMYLCVLGLLIQPIAAAEDGPTIEELIEDLRDDDVRYNAESAHWALTRLPDPPIAQLYAALGSDDWQQRQTVCDAIWNYRYWALYLDDEDRLAMFPVTDLLVEVTIEGAKRDALPYDDEGNCNFVFNARNALRHLPAHAHEYREKLEAGLESDDYQQKLVCAIILSHGGATESVDLVAPILIPHLRDNKIYHDANLAAYGLYQLGDGVIPHLEKALPDADRQQAELIAMLILNFEDPPQDLRDFYERQKMHSITKLVFDPTVERRWRGSGFLDSLARSGMR